MHPSVRLRCPSCWLLRLEAPCFTVRPLSRSLKPGLNQRKHLFQHWRKNVLCRLFNSKGVDLKCAASVRIFRRSFDYVKNVPWGDFRTSPPGRGASTAWSLAGTQPVDPK